MSQATGIPYNVIAAQANTESGFNARAVSGAGAEGWLQFLPSTYRTYATQAGVGQNTEFDPASEAKVYDVYMKSLLQQEGGSVQKALAAYNAGPGNIGAGMSYANQILSEAHSGNITVPGSATTTSNPVSGLLGGSVSGIVSDAFNTLAGLFGASSIKDMIERAGIVLLGVAILIMGLHYLASSGGQPINIQTTSEGGTTKRKVKHPLGTSTTTSATGGAAKTGAERAVEAAAVA
jgi:hypothetical protein